MTCVFFDRETIADAKRYCDNITKRTTLIQKEGIIQIKEETIQKIEVEKCWTWEDEKLMEAYACKKYMDEFRKNR